MGNIDSSAAGLDSIADITLVDLYKKLNDPGFSFAQTGSKRSLHSLLKVDAMAGSQDTLCRIIGKDILSKNIAYGFNVNRIDKESKRFSADVSYRNQDLMDFYLMNFNYVHPSRLAKIYSFQLGAGKVHYIQQFNKIIQGYWKQPFGMLVDTSDRLQLKDFLYGLNLDLKNSGIGEVEVRDKKVIRKKGIYLKMEFHMPKNMQLMELFEEYMKRFNQKHQESLVKILKFDIEE